MKSSVKKSASPAYLEKAFSIYKAYTYFGANASAVVATTSLVDGILAQNYGVTKNYAGLSAFWGYMASNAISKLHESDYVANKYKAPLDVFFALSAMSMVWKGYDFLANGSFDLGKTLNSISLAAMPFEGEEKSISKLEAAFQKSSIVGFSEMTNNYKAILSNKFISNLLLQQGVKMAQLIIIEKFFSNIVSVSKMSLYYAHEKKSGMDSIVKVLVPSVMKFMINTFADSYLSQKLNMDKTVSMKVAEIVLSAKVNTVMELSDDLRSFSFDVNSAITGANNDITGLLRNMIAPLIYANNVSPENDLHGAVKNYPNLIILNHLMNTILSRSNINTVQKYLSSKFGTKTEELKESVGVETTQQNIGGGHSIGITTNSENYAYQNIQEIAKCGASDFMLSQVKNYIIHKKPNESNNNKLLEFSAILKDFINNGMFLLFLPSLNIKTPEDLQKLDILLGRLDEVIKNHTGFINSFGGVHPVERGIETYKALIGDNKSFIASRRVSDEMKLSIKNYCLKKSSDQGNMLFIEQQDFIAGKIYAISGKIGTGKTTVLSDIAECLNSKIFKSSGEILYPSHQGRPVEKIFCGTEFFKPPATTFFECLTYRLPAEFVIENKEKLTGDILEIFNTFGQIFTEEQLSEKKFEGSTGQNKLAILVTAILYKQYLGAPVLFAIDETLANLDKVTSGKVCNYIKKIFSDSIVISVDHNWEASPNFYQDNVDLTDFIPSQEAAVVAAELECKEGGGIFDAPHDNEGVVVLADNNESMVDWSIDCMGMPVYY